MIECRRDRRPDEDDRGWREGIDPDHFCNGRSSAAFGALFGGRNSASFRPHAPDRGLPPDVTQDAPAAYEEWSVTHSASWTGWTAWAELKAADGDEGVRLAVWFGC
ncbi:hypothetical protein ACFXGI_07355 [Streptomyces sp. NPDC059355]|uniref:hypothetical protein n=1 Tax=Streptomyces sp. NPDC059355 TaxID=3346811 RepID=UPI0036B84D83